MCWKCKTGLLRDELTDEDSLGQQMESELQVIVNQKNFEEADSWL